MKKVITIIGARPQMIKASALSKTILTYFANELQEIIIHTGQHYDENMSDVFFNELAIPTPKYMLNVGSGGHGQQTGRMMEEIEKVLLREKPDAVLVYGDTNSTLAGALCASKLHIPLVHIEAGLRSYNRKMPEEINRILTDHISEFLFVPSAIATQNLKKEGISKKKIFDVGDIMFDASLMFSEISDKKSNILQKSNLTSKNYILATIHRAENTDILHRLLNIMEAFLEIAKNIKIILPLHPRTQKILSQNNWENTAKNLQIVAPLGYLDMIALEKNANMICTDSGGVQKEALFYEVPCLTLRDETEWIETVENGYNTLLKPENKDEIIQNIQKVLSAEKIQNWRQLYGDGNTSKNIIRILLEKLK